MTELRTYLTDLLAADGRGFALGPNYPAHLTVKGTAWTCDLTSPTGHPVAKVHGHKTFVALVAHNHPFGTKPLREFRCPHDAELGYWLYLAARRVTSQPKDTLDRLKHLGVLPETVPTPPEGVEVHGLRVRVLQRHGDQWAVYIDPDPAPKYPKAPKRTQLVWPVGTPESTAAEPKHINPLRASIDPKGSEGVWTLGKYGAIRWTSEQPTWGDLDRLPEAPELCPDPDVWAPLCPVMVKELTGRVPDPNTPPSDVKGTTVKPRRVTICGPDWSNDVGGCGTMPDTGIPLIHLAADRLAGLIRTVRATEIGHAGGMIAVRGPRGTAWLMPRKK